MAAHGLLVEARRRAGISQTELARRIGTRQPAVSRWEKGLGSPEFSTVERVVRACGLQMNIQLAPRDDHDLALIRREMSLAPHERLESLTKAVNAINLMVLATND